MRKTIISANLILLGARLFALKKIWHRGNSSSKSPAVNRREIYRVLLDLPLAAGQHKSSAYPGGFDLSVPDGSVHHTSFEMGEISSNGKSRSTKSLIGKLPLTSGQDVLAAVVGGAQQAFAVQCALLWAQPFLDSPLPRRSQRACRNTCCIRHGNLSLLVALFHFIGYFHRLSKENQDAMAPA
jgi:hypothetical protein